MPIEPLPILSNLEKEKLIKVKLFSALSIPIYIYLAKITFMLWLETPCHIGITNLGVYIDRVGLGFIIFSSQPCKNYNLIEPTISSKLIELTAFGLGLDWISLIGLIFFFFTRSLIKPCVSCCREVRQRNNKYKMSNK